MAVARLFYRRHMARCLLGAAFLVQVPLAVKAAEFPSLIELSSLNGSNGFRIDGRMSQEGAGVSIAPAGDVNGDGFPDLIIGARLSRPDNVASTGAAYVVFGGPGSFPATVDLSGLDGTNGFRLDGVAAGDYTGCAVASAGDMNGDGFGDLVVGAMTADPNAKNYSGSAYVVFGKAAGFASATNLSTLNGATGFRLDGPDSSMYVGSRVAPAGDVNGDGFSDVIISAYGGDPNGNTNAGSIYVVFGKPTSFASNINPLTLNGSNGFRLDGAAAGETAGVSVDGTGDVNGDGLSDIVIGALKAAPGNIANAGSTYVVFGKTTAFASVTNLSTLNGTNGFRLDGTATDDFSGQSVAATGDVNGDGFSDLLIGAPTADPNAVSNAGSSYLVFGKAGAFAPSSPLSSLDGSTGFRLDGVTASDGSGRAVRLAGDINGDGYADLVIGAAGADPGGRNQAGSSYVVFGKATGFTSTISLSALNGADGFRLDGKIAGDASGRDVASAGDINGDGFDDVFVSAPNADPNNIQGAGSNYVIFGRAPIAGVVRTGSRGTQQIRGGGLADILIAAGVGDVLEGREGGDLLIGDVSTTASYTHAASGVTANLATGANNGDAASDSYFQISSLEGSRLADSLTGDAKANRLTGGGGKDQLRGGKGKDTFVYRLPGESLAGAANSDVILDFEAGTAATTIDKIDLAAIDANTAKNGNQAFTFRGTSAITGPGQIAIKKVGATIVVRGNTGGSTAPEFEIVLKGPASTSVVTAKDFNL